MTDPERNGFLRRVKQLEQINRDLELNARRWRRLTVAGTAALLILFLLTAAVLTTREQDACKDADYFRWKLENQREQGGFERTGPSGLIGREIE
jgi:hypothetical protein